MYYGKRRFIDCTKERPTIALRSNKKSSDALEAQIRLVEKLAWRLRGCRANM